MPRQQPRALFPFRYTAGPSCQVNRTRTVPPRLPPRPGMPAWARRTQHAALPLPASPPPLPGRLDPRAVGLPFPPEELPLDAGFGALRTEGARRGGKGKRGSSPKRNVPRGLFSYKIERYSLALQPEARPRLGSLRVTSSDTRFPQRRSSPVVSQARARRAGKTHVDVVTAVWVHVRMSARSPSGPEQAAWGAQLAPGGSAAQAQAREGGGRHGVNGSHARGPAACRHGREI